MYIYIYVYVYAWYGYRGGVLPLPWRKLELLFLPSDLFQNQCSLQIASLSASRVLVFGSLGRDGLIRGSDSEMVESNDASEKQLSRDRLPCRSGEAKPTA